MNIIAVIVLMPAGVAGGSEGRLGSPRPKSTCVPSAEPK